MIQEISANTMGSTEYQGSKCSRKAKSPVPRIIGAGVAGGLELLFFHPVDTIAKRLMSNSNPMSLVSGSKGSQISKIIFGEAYQLPYVQRYISLFPGLGFAASYKLLQRVYKFGGQPVVNEQIKTRFGDQFQSLFGQKGACTWIQATSGSIVGIGEVFLLPLDVLKIKSQTNPQALTGRGIKDILMNNTRELYRGAGWTALRNAPGSFALFGGNQLTKTYLFGLEDGERGSFSQLAITSMIGSGLSILVSSPIDVIKTRVQNRSFDSPKSGLEIIKKLIKNEGMPGFFKGLTPKLVIVGPKLVFSFTVAQWLIGEMEKRLK